MSTYTSDERSEQRVIADLVVYGKIFTSENDQIAKAFAVKDGRFIYVGDKQGADTFIEKGSTEVLDYTGKGLVMPSCGNGHAHYSKGHAVHKIGTVIDESVGPELFLKEIVPSAVKKARETGKTSIFGFGWSLLKFNYGEMCCDLLRGKKGVLPEISTNSFNPESTLRKFLMEASVTVLSRGRISFENLWLKSADVLYIIIKHSGK